MEAEKRYSPVVLVGVRDGIINQVGILLVLGSSQDQRRVGGSIRGLVLGNGYENTVSDQLSLRVCFHKDRENSQVRECLHLKSPVSETTVVKFLIWSRAEVMVEDLVRGVGCGMREEKEGQMRWFYPLDSALVAEETMQLEGGSAGESHSI